MSSAYSTITSNVNLLLIDTKVITKNNPYVAYVSSINIPGRIATIRDATGWLSTPNSIVVSTLKNVLFADGTSSFSITQPFGYITLSSRDPNTWNIINTFAFPQPQGVTNVSSLYVNSGIIANSLVVNTFISTNYVNAYSISTNYVNAYSISTINEKASTIFTSTLYANIVSTNILNAVTISTNQIKTSTIFTSTLVLNTAGSNGILSLSNDGKTLLINNIPSGNFTAISTATTNFNMNGFSISNVNNLTLNTAGSNGVLSLSNDGKTLLINNIPSGNFTAISTATTNFNMNGFSISNVNTLNTSNIIVSNVLSANNVNLSNNLYIYDTTSSSYLNPIIAYGGQVIIQNDLSVSNHTTYTTGIVNSNIFNNCNNDITNVNNITVSNLYINDVLTNTPLNPLTASNNYFVFSNSIFMCNRGGLPTQDTNTISNVYNIFNSNLYLYDNTTNTPLNSIIGSNNTIVFGNSINMSNNSINNVLQTSNITDAATNVVVPFYVLASNIAGNFLTYSAWNPLFFSTHPTFTLNTNIFTFGSKFKVNFSFSAIITNLNNILPPFAFYYTLSNTVTNTEYNGLLINSNTPILVSNFYYQVPFTDVYNNSYSFSYEDIFEYSDLISANSDLISVNLYAYSTNLIPIGSVFTNDTHNITFQPIQPA